MKVVTPVTNLRDVRLHIAENIEIKGNVISLDTCDSGDARVMLSVNIQNGNRLYQLV
ncbi:hypothetical protein Desor_3157 [Desulfosporosinus orientis DSM 765]|uniref:Uncharacterized protein n=1 Tax=Desulfosporosinus orientis (strain ATCC 19365 / DSM 765 / NCIMB 8382 / VKM B-1628 / Singapore I) TaxID=768706 RepID=G7W6M9_DESOD|nr:hypothetical protein Desor_3157 [Desulfosporosinus orientis DSM 765]